MGEKKNGTLQVHTITLDTTWTLKKTKNQVKQHASNWFVTVVYRCPSTRNVICDSTTHAYANLSMHFKVIYKHSVS